MTRIIGVVAENSPDFAVQVFDAWENGEAIVVLRNAQDHERVAMGKVEEIRTPAKGSGWFRFSHSASSADGIAQILFTSGTEGRPKGVVLLHRSLRDVVNRLNRVMEVDHTIREYVGVPIYHSFGFGRCRAVRAAGGEIYVPPAGFNPGEINQLLLSGEVNALSAVPSLWRLLLQSNAIETYAGLRVRWIEIGSQYMSRAEKEELRGLFPNARIVQHYGLTEASRSTFLEIDREAGENLESVGRTYGEVETKISLDGRIQIRGPHVGESLIVDGAYRDLKDDQGWLTTSDRGEIRSGYLYYLGRADDMINCGGIKLSPDAVEAAMRRRLPAGGEWVASRIPDALRGDGLLIAATHALRISDLELADVAAAAALELGVNLKGSVRTLRLETLPRTETGKVRRREVADLYTAAQEASAPPSSAPTSAYLTPANLRSELAVILGLPAVNDDDTFANLGGDSLRFIQANLVIQKYLGFVPSGWETKPLGELDALPREKGKPVTTLEPSIILRALAIISVVTSHAGAFEDLFPIFGAAFLLLLPSGHSFARFQLPRVLQTGRALTILEPLPRIILPTLLVIIFDQLRNREFVPTALLLVNNFTEPSNTLSFWFIEVLVQLHVLLLLAFGFKSVRNAFRERPYEASAVMVLVGSVLSQSLARFWEMGQFNLLPHLLIGHHALGWCCLFAKTPAQRWFTSLLIVLTAVAHLPQVSKATWILVGGLFLNLAPAIPMPKWLAQALSAVASASLFIYLSHYFVLSPVLRLFPAGDHAGQLIASLLVGVVFWKTNEMAWRWARKLRDRAVL